MSSYPSLFRSSTYSKQDPYDSPVVKGLEIPSTMTKFSDKPVWEPNENSTIPLLLVTPGDPMERSLNPSPLKSPTANP